MRRSAIVAIGAVALLATATSQGHTASDPLRTREETHRFGFTGDQQRFRVPGGVEEIDVESCGAEGGHGMLGPLPPFDILFGPPGLGGAASATLSVTPREDLTIVVGGHGTPAGGYNGGGAADTVSDSILGPGGGGATDLRRSEGGLDDRVVVGGGGGGGGGGIISLTPVDFATLFGGVGGGAEGGDAGSEFGGGGGQADAGGISPPGSASGQPGALGVGGSGVGTGGGGGGGGGLFGGGSGSTTLGWGGGGGGGSGLGDSLVPGVCAGDGWLEISYRAPLLIRPFGVLVDVEGDEGLTEWRIPVELSWAIDEPVTVHWRTARDDGPGLLTLGVDFAEDAGMVTFAPGETRQYITIGILGDREAEEPLFGGEWGSVEFYDPSPNAVIDRTLYFGHALVIVLDDD